jgi:hypothetical protein
MPLARAIHARNRGTTLMITITLSEKDWRRVLIALFDSAHSIKESVSDAGVERNTAFGRLADEMLAIHEAIDTRVTESDNGSR